VNEGFVHIEDEGVDVGVFVGRQEGRFGFVRVLVERAGEDAVEGDQHHRYLPDFVGQLSVAVAEDLEYKGFEGLEATVADDGPNDLHKELIVFGNQAHLVLAMLYLPSVLVEAESVVDVKLGRQRELLDVDDLHQQLSGPVGTSRMMRLLVWM
jgi:hypothetical protein